MATVLLVDDSMYQRIKIRKFLVAAGHEVIEGKDGDEGLDLAVNSQSDCMILDLLMPNVSGLEVLRALHENRVTLPVIIHTADIQEQTRHECMGLGAVAFLNKPSREEDVLSAIEQAIGHQRKES